SFAGRARYLLASEEVEPGHGWDHRAVSILKTNPTALALGEAVVRTYQAQAVANQDSARITLALTDLDKVPELSRALATLSGAMQAPIDDHAPLVGRARAGITTFGQIPGGPSTGMVDLLEFVDTLAGLDPTLQAPIAAVRGALGSAVVNKVSGPALAGVGGLSVFFPSVQKGYDPDYASLGVANTWRSFLSAYYGAASSLTQSPVFTNPNKEALVTSVLGALHVAGQLQSGTFDNLASTTFDFGLVGQDDTIYVLGDEPADVDRNGLVTKDWNESALQIVQGTTSDFAYYVLEATDNGLVSLSVPLGYEDESSVEFVLLQLVFQLDGTLVSSSYYVQTDGAWAELVPAAGGTYRTLIPTLVSGAAEVSWEPQVEVFDSSNPLDLRFADLPAGTNVFVELTASDFSEQSDSVISAVRL
ncbi:MAG TPA: clostripain-related cysteine peptidase, partial [Polyangiaceae bacterium]|nr:clostripain-related cysteine peptidase [Polyangiaceae bacterium]